jgi:hypothetical protein
MAMRPSTDWAEWVDDFAVVDSVLPAQWREHARACGAMRRARGFSGPEPLLRVLLLHLVQGWSLRETAVWARQAGIAKVSDVALWKRLRTAGEWLRWMSRGLMRQWVSHQPEAVLGSGFHVRIIDGTTVQEPGSTQITWRVHYAISLPELRCEEVYVTDAREGESFERFRVGPRDLFVGDRGYATAANVRHVVQEGGAVLVRINLTNLPLLDANDKPVRLLRRLRSLKGTQLGDWPVLARAGKYRIPGRLCALKKSRAAAKRARTKALSDNQRKGHQVRPETLESAGYTFVFTTLPASVKASSVLELYRGRWQIELAFKRLKSLIGIGHLRKTDPESAKAWIHGKLLAAFLIEALLAAAERFSPWGYPLQHIPRSLA